MKVVAINGSHKNDGSCAFLIDTMFEVLKNSGADTKCFNALEVVSDCTTPFCVSCSSPCAKVCYGEKLTKLFDQMESADAIIFASPVYFGSMSGQLKCIFDKTRDLRGRKALLGKIGVAIASGASKYGGQEKTIDAITNCMLVNGMTIIGPSSSELMGHMGVCAQAQAKDDDFAIDRAKSAAKRILEMLVH